MFCSKCGRRNQDGLNYCRACGTGVVTKDPIKDPDELTGKGIRDVIIGDGFLIVALILGVTSSAVSSFLWLSLLIPAFYFFGMGFSSVLYAKQIRKRLEHENLINTSRTSELPPARQDPIIEVFRKSISGELLGVPSVTEKTTRGLEHRKP